MKYALAISLVLNIYLTYLLIIASGAIKELESRWNRRRQV